MDREDPESVSSNSEFESELFKIERSSGGTASIVSSDNALACKDFADIVFVFVTFSDEDFVEKFSVEILSDVFDDRPFIDDVIEDVDFVDDDFVDEPFFDSDVVSLSFSDNDFVDNLSIEILSDIPDGGSLDKDTSAVDDSLDKSLEAGDFGDNDIFGNGMVDCVLSEVTLVVEHSAVLLTSLTTSFEVLLTTL